MDPECEDTEENPHDHYFENHESVPVLPAREGYT